MLKTDEVYYERLRSILVTNRNIEIRDGVDIIIFYGYRQECYKIGLLWKSDRNSLLSRLLKIKQGETVMINMSMYRRWIRQNYS